MIDQSSNRTVLEESPRCRTTGVRIVTSLLVELDDAGQIDHDLWCFDGSVIRASRAAAGGGMITKAVTSLI
jgi:hypothetical protein